MFTVTSQKSLQRVNLRSFKKKYFNTSSMKKFIEKKVTDYKFKKAGPGHSLTEDSKASSSVKPGKLR